MSDAERLYALLKKVGAEKAADKQEALKEEVVGYFLDDPDFDIIIGLARVGTLMAQHIAHLVDTTLAAVAMRGELSGKDQRLL